MEFGTTDPMTGDKKKMFFFYPLLAISPQNLAWLDHNFKHGSEKLKYHVTMTYVGHLDIIISPLSESIQSLLIIYTSPKSAAMVTHSGLGDKLKACISWNPAWEVVYF